MKKYILGFALEDFVLYEHAVALKELWFDEPCFFPFNKEGEICWNEKVFHNIQHQRYDFPIFEEESIHYIGIRAPTYSQAFRFFRKKYKLHSYIISDDCTKDTYGYHIDFLTKEEKDLYMMVGVAECEVVSGFNTPEEAEVACLIKLIEIVKNKPMIDFEALPQEKIKEYVEILNRTIKALEKTISIQEETIYILKQTNKK